MNDQKTTTLLMILDGYGMNKDIHGNAILQAQTPHIDELFRKYPNTTLGASGLDVGLPTGQMGNSEVGHLNIGAGRVVYQELTKITKAIKDGTFFKNEALNQAMDHALHYDSALHLLGLLSDGGVHSHIDHVFALLDLAKEKGLKKVYVHALLDGRDVPPRCAAIYLNKLESYMKQIGLGHIAMISGRYYGMDRDNRWDRVEKAYNAMTLGIGEKAANSTEAITQAYKRDENDEFVLPTLIEPTAPVNDNDAFIMFNFRPDRAREITRCFVDETFDGFKRQKTISNLHYVCLTQYDLVMPNVQVAFPPQSLKNTLGEYVAQHNLRQLRIAETEKYAHVTFFFNGGIEAPNKGEDRILVPSPKVATYDLKPEMSAYEVAERVIAQIESNTYDLIVLNFANADMVGHSGLMEAAVKAIEALDNCVPKVIQALLAKGGQGIITADHGNADAMLDDKDEVLTAHSLNPVPFIVLANSPIQLRDHGILADVAPTLLDLMNLEKPEEMTGRSMIL
ncbi:MAG: 2,3-bisphosphoglycerate-independent phosphoglycerate mutase [Anaerovorax sp.]